MSYRERFHVAPVDRKREEASSVVCSDLVYASDLELGERDIARIKSVVLELLEQRFAVQLIAASHWAEDWQTEVAAQAAETASQRMSEGDAEVQFVRNAHPNSLIVHVIRDPERARCGWEYTKSPWHEIVAHGGPKARQCRDVQSVSLRILRK